MKNLILITCVLIVNLSFSQKDSNPFSKKVFYSNIEENHYEVTTFDFFALEKQEKINPINTIKAINNSEGKFPFYSNEDQHLFDIEINHHQKNIVNPSSTSVKNKKDFIDTVILKILKNKNIDISDFQNSLDFNGDKNINFYKNYNTDVNKLIFAYQLQDKTEFVIGTDIHNFMNMILKTEINKTLQNSLNLFAINF
jgi:hypothetical protein